MQVAELQALVEQYLQGGRSARELFRSIQAFAIPLTAEDAEPDAKRLYDRTWLLLTERSQGDRTDQQVRRALRAELKRFQREPPVNAGLPSSLADCQRLLKDKTDEVVRLRGATIPTVDLQIGQQVRISGVVDQPGVNDSPSDLNGTWQVVRD